MPDGRPVQVVFDRSAVAAFVGVAFLGGGKMGEALVSGLVRAGDIVLVKASRGIGLETVAEALARG